MERFYYDLLGKRYMAVVPLQKKQNHKYTLYEDV